MADGYVLWEGDSPVDGEPIVAIWHILSRNDKTGNMAQICLLCRDKPPTEAVKDGSDKAICGSCKFRGGACYVLPYQMPLNIWKTYKKGKYPKITPEDYRFLIRENADVRFGSYGDPAFIPLEIVKPIISEIKKQGGSWTGYTHQWTTESIEYARYFMASVETEKEVQQAKGLGYKYYRVKDKDDDTPLSKGEAHCPYELAKNDMTKRKIQCKTCGLCSGVEGIGKANIVNNVHGSAPKLKAWRELGLNN